MDTKLGNIQITKNQIENLKTLHTEVIKGFCYWENGDLIVTTVGELTSKEKTDLLVSVQELPDTAQEVAPTLQDKVDALWDLANGDDSKMVEVQAKEASISLAAKELQ